MTPPDEPNHEPHDVLIELRPVREPLTLKGNPPRDANYRLKPELKTLQLIYGLKCVACHDLKAETPAGERVRREKLWVLPGVFVPAPHRERSEYPTDFPLSLSQR